MRYLFDLAISNNIQRDYVLSVYDTVLEKNNFDWLSAACMDRLKKIPEAFRYLPFNFRRSGNTCERAILLPKISGSERKANCF
jgi:hypothetical protein